MLPLYLAMEIVEADLCEASLYLTLTLGWEAAENARIIESFVTAKRPIPFKIERRRLGIQLQMKDYTAKVAALETEWKHLNRMYDRVKERRRQELAAAAKAQVEATLKAAKPTTVGHRKNPKQVERSLEDARKRGKIGGQKKNQGGKKQHAA